MLNPLHAAGTKVEKKKSTGYGNDALARKSKAEAARKNAQKPPPTTIVPAPKRSDRPRSRKQLAALSGTKPLRPLVKRKRGKPRKAAAVALQRVGANLCCELETAAEAEQRAAVEVEERETAAAEAAAHSAAFREEVARDLREDGVRRAAYLLEVEASKAAAAAAAAEASAAQERHNQCARERELAEIERAIKLFSNAFAQKHGRKPTPRDMKSAAYSRERMQIERYNQLKHGITPAGLRR